MKLIYKILRFIFVTLLLVVPVAAVTLYVVLSIPGVQRSICNRAQSELTTLLGTPVEIGEVQIAPFNRITISDAVVRDEAGEEAIHVGHLGAGISLTDLLIHGRIVVSYTELIDFNVNLYRDSASSPLNVAPILEKLKGKEGGGKTSFDLAVNTIVIRRGSMDYNVLSEPEGDSTKFDNNHIHLSGFRADITIPRLASEAINLEVKRLAAEEKCGLAIENLRFNFLTGSEGTNISDLRLDVGRSRFYINKASTDLPILDMNGRNLAEATVQFTTMPGTVIYPSDFAPVVPKLAGFNTPFDLDIEVEGELNCIRLKRLALDARDGNATVNVAGAFYDLPEGPAEMRLDIERLSVITAPQMLSTMISQFASLSDKASELIERAGNVELLGKGALSFAPLSVEFDGSVSSAPGGIDIDAMYVKPDAGKGEIIEGTVTFADLNPDVLLESKSVRLSRISGEIAGSVSVAGLSTEGQIDAKFSEIELNDNEINGLALDAKMSGRRISAELASTDIDFGTRLSVNCDLTGQLPVTKVVGQFDNIDLSSFLTGGILSQSIAGMTLVADITGNHPDNLSGRIKASDIYLIDNERDKRINIDLLSVAVKRDDDMATMDIDGDFIDGNISGRLAPSAVIPAVTRVLSSLYPAFIKSPRRHIMEEDEGDALAYGFTFKPDSSLCRYFDLPVEVIDDARLWGVIDTGADKIDLNLDAPYLWKKGKLIEETTLTAVLDGRASRSSLKASTTMPSKYGPMTLTLNSDGKVDNALVNLGWHIDAPGKYEGALKVNSTFYRDSTAEEHPICGEIDVMNSKIVFNDTVWEVAPSRISLTPGRIAVDNFHVGRLGQQLDINGTVTPDSTDYLIVKLQNIDLGYVFETLGINHVTFGGIATGNFYASQLLQDTRRMFTPALDVKGFSYNGCVLGDAILRSRWVPETQGIAIKADITEDGGRHSFVDGEVRPVASELDFDFDADRLPVGFLSPFMEAFADNVEGRASGHARLFGDFHNINLSGELLAEDFSMRVKFTNTSYTVAHDSIHIVPGRIAFDNIKLHDKYGNPATLNGELTHYYFHDASFRFNVTDARDLLCYDINERMTTDAWYGRVFGSGGVDIRGIPGMININVNLTTAPQTVFTLKLDDSESAAEYDFITFHDRDKARKDSIAALNPLPLIIQELRQRRQDEDDGPPTEYFLDFNLDVTPVATLNIIMDPATNDKISAVGSGHFNMSYASTGDFKIFGKYLINRGSYNFTLQDIILKEFNLVEGSLIEFKGNPDAAELKLKATYTVNANLTDLDESFSQDKDLNRTNVPVNAVLLVSGDMRQPGIDFDLEFPTLTRDVDRKVRSIVSTEDMMSRQIIYLLALNRFYTPDYMNATRGNELVSVASSTISSQLSSMLGQLSDKWSIAPNFRSDRGDFSDVEVDVALSSHLLNNRLLLNGNFGYRDKSLNNNSFIGDFDIRYLLNRTGSIALKAYNRYNDQNYYLKSALTTQGIGVVFKRDFDNWLEFLNPFRKRRNKTPQVQAPDSVQVVVTDTLTVTMPQAPK